jgi:hypothetical protein
LGHREKIWGVAPDGSTKGYLTNFNKSNGIEFIEESVRMNLARQLAGLSPGEPKMAEVYVQALFWFGPELGRITFEALLTARVGEAMGTADKNDPMVQAEVGRMMGSLVDSFGLQTGADRS